MGILFIANELMNSYFFPFGEAKSCIHIDYVFYELWNDYSFHMII